MCVSTNQPTTANQMIFFLLFFSCDSTIQPIQESSIVIDYSEVDAVYLPEGHTGLIIAFETGSESLF